MGRNRAIIGARSADAPLGGPPRLRIRSCGWRRRVFEYCDAPLPFPPGQSPFHIKGQFYIQTMRALQRIDKPLVALLPDDLRAFCSQEFLASQWYDVLPFHASP